MPASTRVFGLSVPTRDTGLRDHVRGLGWTLLRTYFELAIDLTEGSLAEVEWPAGMTMRTFGEATVVEPAIAVMTDAFADHHGDGPPPDTWRHMLTAEVVLPDASYLLDDADGPVGGLVSSDFGDGEGYIGPIGVRRRGRGRGPRRPCCDGPSTIWLRQGSPPPSWTSTVRTRQARLGSTSAPGCRCASPPKPG